MVRNLRRQLDLAAIGLDAHELRGRSIGSAEQSFRRVLVALAFHRGAARREETKMTDGADAATPAAGCRYVLAQLVAFDPQRHVGFDVLDRIVARIGIEHVDGIHAVHLPASAIASGEELDLEPEITALLTREQQATAIAATTADLPGHDLAQRLHDSV
jgi:hypothetical protein